MAAALQLDDYDNLDELYRDVELLIWDTCHKFARKYGGDVNEHFADASTFFMKAFKKYDPNKGAAFSTVLHWTIWGGLLDAVRLASQRNSRLTRQPDDCLEEYTAKRHFDVLQFKRSLSRDAALVVHLTTALPGDLEYVAKHAGISPRSNTTERKQSDFQLIKTAVSSWLVDWGWSAERIRESFMEVSQAL